MYKILTFGLLILSSQSSFAMDELSMAMDISMKSIVRTKLWYEGIDMEKSVQLKGKNRQSLPKEASEELIVALEKFEQI